MTTRNLTPEAKQRAADALRSRGVDEYGPLLLAFADSCIDYGMTAVRERPDIEASEYASQTVDGMSIVAQPSDALDAVRESRELLKRSPELGSGDEGIERMAVLNLYEIGTAIVMEAIEDNRPSVEDYEWDDATPETGEVVIGKCEDGFIYIRAELRDIGEDTLRLSIAGRMRSTAGQIDQTLRGEEIEPAPGWDAESIAHLLAVWDRWHLNDMNAACEHLRALAAEKGKTPHELFTTDSTCTACGHKYGHAWHTEDLPADVVAWLRERFPKIDEPRR
jgi:hypothetical protein